MIKKVALNCALAILSLWSILAAGFNSSNTVGVAAAGLGFWLCISSMAVLVAALAMRKTLVASALAVLVVITSLWFHVIPSEPFGTGSTHGSTVKVLQLNTLLDTASPTALAKLAHENKVDFAVLAETDSKFRPWHNHRLLSELPNQFAQDANYPNLGNTIFSRWPLIATGEVRGTTNPAIWATAVVRGKFVTVLAVRSQNPLVSRTQWKNDLGKIGAWVAMQRPQVHLIVAGDFNATFGHSPFDDMLAKNGLRDAAAEVNWPWQRFTFPTKPINAPLMQIDHILVTSTYSVNSVARSFMPLTDHSVTVATLVFGRE